MTVRGCRENLNSAAENNVLPIHGTKMTKPLFHPLESHFGAIHWGSKIMNTSWNSTKPAFFIRHRIYPRKPFTGSLNIYQSSCQCLKLWTTSKWFFWKYPVSNGESRFNWIQEFVNDDCLTPLHRHVISSYRPLCKTLYIKQLRLLVIQLAMSSSILSSSKESWVFFCNILVPTGHWPLPNVMQNFS